MKYSAIIAVILQFMYSHIPHADAKSTWTKATYELKNKMVKQGMDEDLAKVIINECKAKAKDPRHCVVTASFISSAESSMGNSLDKCNNVFWVTGVCAKTRTEAVKDWVTRYNKYWYKTKGPHEFYSNTPKRIPRTYYCMSEHSSGAEGYCPNGFNHASDSYAQFKTK